MMDRVNKDLFPIKSHYFLYSAATGAIQPFVPTIAKQIGFSATVTGTITTILPILGLIAKPLFCGIADRFNLHKAILIFFQAILALGFLVIHFIPEVEPSAKVTLICKYFAFEELPLVNDPSLHNVIDYEYKNNSYADCHMSCKANYRAYEELCNSWGVQDYCHMLQHIRNESDILPDETFDFEAKFNMYKKLKIGDKWNLRLETAKFADGITRNVSCKEPMRTTCATRCYDDPLLTKLLKTQLHEESFSETIRHYQFHLFLFATIVSWVGMSVVVNIADSICFALLGEEKRKDYGKQKMWGSIGFGIFGISAGYLVDVFSKNDEYKDYTCIFYIMMIAMICDVIVSFTIKKSNVPSSTDEPSIMKELCLIGKDPAVLVFIFWCIGAGMCTGIVWNFFFWYTEDVAAASQKHWIKTVQGLLTGVQCFLGELPFNFAYGAILKKLGHVNVMSLILLVYAMRFMAYSMVTNVWVFLILEVLHGPSFGLCWPALVSYGEKVAPPGTKATIQGLIGAIFEGIGVSLGSLSAGYLIDTYQGMTTFRIFSGGALAWLAIFWVLQLLLRKSKSLPLSQGHSHLHATYMPPDDALLVTMSQEMTTY